MNRSVKDKITLAATFAIAGAAGTGAFSPAAHAGLRPAAAHMALLDTADPDDLVDQAVTAYNAQNYAASIDLCNKALAIRPAMANAFYSRGLAYVGLGKLDLAAADLSKYLTFKPKAVDGYVDRGIIYEQQKNYDGAIGDFNTALTLAPTNTDAMHNLADSYFFKGDLDQAISAYKRYAAAADASADPKVKSGAITALHNLGLCYAKKGDDTSAIANYKEYLAAKPTDADAILDLADAEDQGKQYDVAITDYKKYLVLHPADTDGGYAHQQIALDLLKKNDYAGAADMYKQIVASSPNDKAAWNNLTIACTKAGQFPGAVDAASHLISLDPSNVGGYSNRADAEMKTGQQANAIADYGKVISLKPDAVAYYNRGVAYTEMKNWQNAKADFSSYLQAKPGDLAGYKGRAIAESNLKEYPAAVADDTAYLAQKPDDIAVKYDRGLANYNAGNVSAALPDIQAYVAAKPDDKQASDLLNTILVGSDPTKAIEGLVKATQAEPGNADNFYNLGVAYSKTKQYANAAEAFGKAGAIKPDGDTYNQEGIAYNTASKPTEAAAAFSKAITADPHYAAAYLNRGDLDVAAKEYDKGIADYTQYLTLAPTMTPPATPDQMTAVYLALAAAYVAKSDFTDASATYGKLLQISPGNGSALYGRGVAEYNSKDFDKAIADLSSATKSPNAPAGAWNVLALCDIQKQDYPGAITAYTSFIGTNPKDPKVLAAAYVNRGLAYSQSGDLDKAVADYQQAATLSPTDAAPYYDMGLALEKQAKKAEDASDGSAAANAKVADQYQAASDAFTKYTTLAPPTDPQVAKVKEHITELAAKIKDLKGG
jgi:tetratricopeptide (TPR) repeat protein